MPRPLFMQKPSEPLGVAHTLEELLRKIEHAADVYGPDTRIYGYNQNSGIALHIHFPDGVAPHITFRQVDIS